MSHKALQWNRIREKRLLDPASDSNKRSTWAQPSIWKRRAERLRTSATGVQLRRQK